METTVSIGVDVAKAKLDICFAKGVDEYLKLVCIENSSVGIEKFIQSLCGVSKEIPLVVESTGDYHILFCLMVSSAGYNVCLINPIITKKAAKSQVRPQKSDKVDARLLSEIGIIQRKKLRSFVLSANEVLLKKKLSLIGSLQKKKQSMKSSLRSIQEAYGSLGEEIPVQVHILEDLLDEIDSSIKSIEKTLVEDIASFEAENLTHISSIAGVSRVSAAKVLTYLIGKDFDNVSQITAFAGLDITTKESGTSVHGRGVVSKRGDPLFRKTLFQIAWGLMMHNEVFKKLYQYYKDKGKHYFTILTIIARKFLKTIFGMMKHHTLFNPDVIVTP